MQGFSGVVRISNVSDFIEPSQKCVLPLANADGGAQQKPSNLVGIHAKTLTNSQPKRTTTVGEKIRVTLSDCLACSGCITTAETMLVESQTIEQMLKGFYTHSISVVTISPQSVCSLAVHFGLSPSETAVRLAHFFQSLGAHYVIDSSFARILAHRMIYAEFRERHLSCRAQSLAENRTTWTGVCPGFVCYAEKTHGDLLVPHISRVRSPQALSALFVKDYLRLNLNEIAWRSLMNPADIFHVCVMPCYDKKLEASRGEFVSNDGVYEVDCVVTASELITLISSSTEYADLFDSSVPSTSDSTETDLPDWLRRFASGCLIGDANRESSGGYAAYVVQRMLHDFHGATVERIQRNKDLEEFHVYVAELGSEPVVIAKLYGFRNIQNAVQKLKRRKLRIDFVEVMACPSGCSNGGGQIRGEIVDERSRISNAVNDAYASLADNDQVMQTELDGILRDWKRFNPSYETKLLTDYHPIKPNLNSGILGDSW